MGRRVLAQSRRQKRCAVGRIRGFVGAMVAAMALASLCACSTSRPYSYPPPPGLSARRVQLIKRLQRAEEHDRGNSHAWNWSNPMLDALYRQKAEEVQAVILRLEAGEDVPPSDIKHALDNSEARQLGGY